MSLGVDASTNMRRDNGAMDKALKYAYAQGVTVVAAAGNENVKQASELSIHLSKCLSVGATDYLNRRAPYSKGGDGITLMAPGGNTLEDRNRDELWRRDSTRNYIFTKLRTSLLSRNVHGNSPRSSCCGFTHFCQCRQGHLTIVRNVLTKSAKNLGTSRFRQDVWSWSSSGSLGIDHGHLHHRLLRQHQVMLVETGQQSVKPLRAQGNVAQQAANGCQWKRRRCRTKS